MVGCRIPRSEPYKGRDGGDEYGTGRDKDGTEGDKYGTGRGGDKDGTGGEKYGTGGDKNTLQLAP